VASKLFDTVIDPEQIVTEMLERLTQGCEPESSQLVESLTNDYSEEATAHWEPGDLHNHPLAYWVELYLGLEREEGLADGKWVRCEPKTLQRVCTNLTQITQLLEEQTLKQFRNFLLATYHV